ncbi:MAG: respiratory nitrate reductase subunit gamma [Chloroflexi bacterium]|nr:respiratory nitrate reductase subunit gamma [Chloroflexota bacterium]
MVNTALFVVFPYVAVVLAIAVLIYRYARDRVAFSSQSSQFLESPLLFWGSVPWHYGILLILLVHITVLVFSGAWKIWVAVPARLYTFEIIGMVLAALSLVGLIILVIRRLSRARVFATSTVWDWLVLVALLVQVGSGLLVAILNRWGLEWSLNTVVPWLLSIVRLNPQPEDIIYLPLLVKLHAVNAFVLIALLPFTRLMHIVNLPISYLWRPYQVVVWNRRPRVRS